MKEETLCPKCGSNVIFGTINGSYRECHECEHKFEAETPSVPLIEIKPYGEYPEAIYIGGELLEGQPSSSSLQVAEDTITLDLFVDERLHYHHKVMQKLKSIESEIVSRTNITDRGPKGVETIRLVVRKPAK